MTSPFPATHAELIEVMRNLKNCAPDFACEIDKKTAAAVLEAIEAADCTVVPNEATEEMVEAGVHATWGETLGSRVFNCHRDMTAASPFAPAKEG